MKGIGILLLRCGSKRYGFKNIQLLNGRPLAYYTIDFMLSDESVTSVIVSSDCEEVLNCIEKYNSERIILHRRSDLNSKDVSQTEDALVEVVEYYEKEFSNNYEFVLYAQATEPLRPIGLLAKAINEYRSGSFDTVFAAFAYHKNFWIVDDNGPKRITNNGESSLPRQIKQPIFREDTGICLISSPDVIRSGKRIGETVKIIPYEHIGALLDIHSRKDFLLAEYLIKVSSKLEDENIG